MFAGCSVGAGRTFTFGFGAGAGRSFTFGRDSGARRVLSLGCAAGAGRTFTFGCGSGARRVLSLGCAAGAGRTFTFGCGAGAGRDSSFGCERTLMFGRVLGTGRAVVLGSAGVGATVCVGAVFGARLSCAFPSVCDIPRVTPERGAPRVCEIGSGATGLSPVVVSCAACDAKVAGRGGGVFFHTTCRFCVASGGRLTCVAPWRRMSTLCCVGVTGAPSPTTCAERASFTGTTTALRPMRREPAN